MIIDNLKVPLPNDPTPLDAPPSYETLVPQLQSRYQNGKAVTSPLNLPAGSSSILSPAGFTSPSQQHSGLKSPTSPASSGPSTGKGKCKSNWFNFSASRTTRDVRTTVLGLVKDLVREHHSTHSPAPEGILQSCADACSSNSLRLSSILQEKSIENHTPLYWAIVKRLPDEEQEQQQESETSTTTTTTNQLPDLLSVLLSHSTPLTPETVADIRHACLVTSDQLLFQRLRLSPEFSTISGVDQMLLGATLPQDDIVVEDVPGDEGSFAVDFEIPHFQKRMRVSQEIVLEFIARSRMWKLTFSIAKENNGAAGPRPGSWCITLSLQDDSPPTWIDSRLIVPEPIIPSQTIPSPPIDESSSSSSSSPSSSILRSASSTFGFPSLKPKPKKPTITIRLSSQSQLVAPRGYYNLGKSVVVSLEDSLMGASLQYAGSSYIAPDEKLRARLEARLQRPEAECIIC